MSDQAGAKLAELIRPYRLALVTAFLLRISWALLVPVIPLSDSLVYREFAVSLVGGKGFAFADGTLTAYWPVGTSAVYAVVYSIFGTDSHLPIVGLNLLLGLLIVVIGADLARRLMGDLVGRLTAWALAVWPALIQFTTILASELLFVALVLVALWLQQSHRSGLLRGLVMGLTLAGAVYVRPTAFPLIGIILLADVLRRPGLGNWCWGAFGLLLSFTLAMAPWVERNARVVGGPKLVSTNFGPNFWMGNNPASTGAYMPLPERAFTNEVERDAFYTAEALLHIRAEPLRYVERCIRRAIDTFGRETIGVVWNAEGLAQGVGSWSLTPLKILSTGYWWGMLVLGVAGLAQWIWRTRSWLHPMTLSFGLFFVVPVLTVSQDRYHMPLNPLLAFGAAALVASRFSRSTLR